MRLMKTLVNNTKQFNDKYTTEEEVLHAVKNDIKRFYNVADTDEDIEAFFEGRTDYESSVEQTFDVQGMEDEDHGYIPMFNVRIESNYVDAGSVDYIYTIQVYEL